MMLKFLRDVLELPVVVLLGALSVSAITFAILLSRLSGPESLEQFLSFHTEAFREFLQDPHFLANMKTYTDDDLHRIVRTYSFCYFLFPQLRKSVDVRWYAIIKRKHDWLVATT